VRRRAALGAVLGVGLAALAFALSRGPRDAPSAAAPVIERTKPGADVVPPPDAEAAFTRNPFEYGEAQTPVAVQIADPDRPAAARAMELPLAPEPVVRLVGFLRTGGKPRVALMVRGEMALLEVGEEWDGFTLLAADPETGARLRDPAGAEIALAVEP
jgi:hypothetical protein